MIYGKGTINTGIARNLPPTSRTTIITINPQIASHLSVYHIIGVILTKGHLNKSELVISDAETIDWIRHFQAGACFL
ncbi:MAG: hypothetical protein GYA18_04545 [Chloroflexi bacterium]|nr:hypothetical protein [Chloroflexota bacterium]